MEKMASSMATTMNATSTPMPRMMAGSSSPMQSLQLGSHVALERLGGLDEHLLQPAGLLTDAHHVDGEGGEGRASSCQAAARCGPA